MINQALSRILRLEIARFLLSGGLNTALTYGIYLLVLLFLPYKTSYTISYISGIGIAYALNRFFVFKGHQGIKSIAFLPFIYLIQYLFSLLIVWVWVEKLGYDQRVAPLIAITITIPLTFILSKMIFSKKPLNSDNPQ
ncbi:GtrA family protein [Pseudomonas sp. WJP1]|uniref:GtrA family protein n=1 Tax=Pseudomonas sp. WJP1 TaxID=2986947 RepID=UPI00234A18EE|nr:GtrA family protein [Pseudomonas sp. WJP1]WCM53073.1 GtrA family protein [Pseudomonas sp. WJP1]